MWSPIKEKNAYALYNNPHVVNRDQIWFNIIGYFISKLINSGVDKKRKFYHSIIDNFSFNIRETIKQEN
jgi:hypothetical protein